MGKSSYDEPESSQQLARISEDLYRLTDPVRTSLIGSSNAFLAGPYDYAASPMWAPLKLGAERQFDQSQDRIMSMIPAGGQLESSLAQNEMARAAQLAAMAGGLTQDEMNRAMQVGFGTLGGVQGGLSQSAASQAAAMQAAAQQQSAKGQALGLIAGSALGGPIGGGLGSKIGAPVGGFVGSQVHLP